ncbi:hypothetical protein NIES4072_25870 [Nostoc commune NIES-4072]|uniref:Uncharacterized protein n=1 Tax=Nostoc commune NIES-4072 TaxID=2005467 RepID=A0A2R5FJH6_NOSCO|nr:hypothetical protein NIES4070_00990 [Nostoc commune HK-02]GBG18922.1 hypothetical protein NIES4072_25870 [Nostoc commune NIES-4072]
MNRVNAKHTQREHNQDLRTNNLKHLSPLKKRGNSKAPFLEVGGSLIRKS